MTDEIVNAPGSLSTLTWKYKNPISKELKDVDYCYITLSVNCSVVGFLCAIITQLEEKHEKEASKVPLPNAIIHNGCQL